MGILINDMPLLAPYKCVGCNSGYGGDGRKFIDTNIHVDHYGQLYICQHCMIEIAREVNIIPWVPQRELELKVGNLEMQNAALRESLARLDFIGTGRNPYVSLDESTDLSLETNVEGGKGASKRPTKQSAKSDSGSVRGTSKLDELLSSG